MQRIQGAEQRDDHDGTEDEITVRAKDPFRGQPEGKVIAGDFAHGEHIENRCIDQQINQNDGKEAKPIPN